MVLLIEAMAKYSQVDLHIRLVVAFLLLTGSRQLLSDKGFGPFFWRVLNSTCVDTSQW
jgi:hypothetical protein